MRLQIIASASTVYDIPWPPQFMSFISTLRVFLVDVVSITKANCAQPMNYYDSLLLVLVGLKVLLVLMLLGPWAWGKLVASDLNITSWCRQRSVRRQVRVDFACCADFRLRRWVGGTLHPGCSTQNHTRASDSCCGLDCV